MSWGQGSDTFVKGLVPSYQSGLEGTFVERTVVTTLFFPSLGQSSQTQTQTCQAQKRHAI